MTPATHKVKLNITIKNVNRLAWQAGFEGVAGLARHLKRNRTTIWKAVRWPDQHSPTFNLICEALNGAQN